MAPSASDLLAFVLAVTWDLLCDTPFNQKNTLFARFFTSLSVIQAVAAEASITLAPGLLDVVRSATPPTIAFFKSLPTSPLTGWGIYALTLEKPGHQFKLYVGSGTSTGSVALRLKQYDDDLLLPVHVSNAIHHKGYSITHKGLLCWCPLPSAATVPVRRLLFVALEAAFAFMFWTFRAKKGDYGLGHICLWDRHTLVYDGLCSHSSLNEGLRGDFDLNAEQLEAQAIEKEIKRLEMKKDNATNWHYKQMETNYDEYIGKAGERVKRFRKNRPGRYLETQAARAKKDLAEKRYHCETCDISFTTAHSHNDHMKSAKHARKAKGVGKHKCIPCNLGFDVKSNFNRHNKSEGHKKKLAAMVAQSSAELD